MQLKFHSFVCRDANINVDGSLIRGQRTAYDFYRNEQTMYIEALVTYQSFKYKPQRILFAESVPPYSKETHTIKIPGMIKEKPAEVKARKSLTIDQPVLFTRQIRFGRDLFDRFECDKGLATDHVGMVYDKQKDSIILVDLRHMVTDVKKDGRYRYSHPYYKYFIGVRGVNENNVEAPAKVKHVDKWSKRHFDKTIIQIPLPALNKLDYAVKKDIVISGYEGNKLNNPIYKTTKERI